MKIVQKEKETKEARIIPTPYLLSLSISVHPARDERSRCTRTCIDRSIDLDHDINPLAMIKLVA